MTEAGIKWALEQQNNADPDGMDPKWENVDALSRRAAEFWIRAFCEKTRGEIGEWHSDKGDQYHEILGYAFANVERELLGE